MKQQNSQIGWKETTLNEVAKFINGRAFKPSEWEQKGKLIIRIQDLTGSGTSPNYSTKPFEKKYLVKNGDLLISWSATLDVFIWNKEEGWLNQHIFKVEEDKNIIDKKYLFYLVKTKIEEMKKNTHGSTMKHITKGDFERIKILLPFSEGKPDLKEQERIVSVLEKTEKVKARGDNAKKLLDEYLKSAFNEMFYNKGFEKKTLKQICIKITDGTHKTPKYQERGIPFLRVTDLTNSNDSKKFISLEEHKELIKRCKPEKGDILYSKNGTIGVAKTIDWDYEFSIFVSLCLIRPDKNIILPKFLEFFLNTPFALNQAFQHSKKGTITNLHLNEINKMTVPLPPIPLQQRFVKLVEHVEELKENVKKTKQNSGELFNYLMQKAFRGEL